MKILYLTINPNKTSTAVPLQGWINCLANKDLSPVIASDQNAELLEWSKSKGIPTYFTPLPFPSKLKFWHFFKSLWKLRKIIKDNQIELIHANEQKCYPIAAYLAKISGLPAVVSIHFTMRRDFCAWAFNKHLPERVFFVSAGNQEACRQSLSGIVPFDKWRILNNGIDLSYFQPDTELRSAFRNKYGLGDSPVIGVACALRERKQVQHFFSVAAKLNPNVKVILAGGPVADELKEAQELTELGKKLLGDRLLLLGHVQDLRAFYNALDIFVNTSKEEACSISVIESLACGCPVLGYPSKSVDSQILPLGGEIIKQDDTSALLNALEKWLSSGEELKERRAGARKQAEKNFDIQSISQQLLQEYRTILGK